MIGVNRLCLKSHWPCPFRLCRLMCGGGCVPPKAAGLVLGYARIRAKPIDLLGRKMHQGHSPNVKRTFTAGHSHRRTSGGKAET